MTMHDFGRFQTQSTRMIELLNACEKWALTTSPISLSGECGSGRKTLARWIHDKSPGHGRFIVWSVEMDELIQLKSNDTLLIENINELDSQELAQLRNFLNKFEGASQQRFRLICTMTSSLQHWMEQSLIAREMAYQLCVVNIRVPSLSERLEDIQLLSNLFMRIACLMNGIAEKTLSSEALSLLQAHHWLGNVAELNNVIERAVLNSIDHQIQSSDLVFLDQETNIEENKNWQIARTGISLFEMERKLILQTLELTHQNKTRAAQILGISIRTLRNKLNTYRQVEVA